MTTTIAIAIAIGSLLCIGYGIYKDKQAEREAKAQEPVEPAPLPQKPSGWPPLHKDELVADRVER